MKCKRLASDSQTFSPEKKRDEKNELSHCNLLVKDESDRVVTAASEEGLSFSVVPLQALHLLFVTAQAAHYCLNDKQF